MGGNKKNSGKTAPKASPSFDNDQLGENASEHMAEKYDGKGKIEGKKR